MVSRRKFRPPPGVIPSTDGNIFTWSLYRLAYPAAWLANFMGIPANWLSLSSLLLAVGATVTLQLTSIPAFFALLWLGSVLLDFADGPVARLSNKANTTAFRLDHTLDLIKLSIATMGIALFWNSTTVWVLSLLAITCILVFTVLNHDLAHTVREHGEPADRRRLSKTTFRRIAVAPIVTLHGGSILLLALAAFGSLAAIVILTYLSSIATLMAIRNSLILRTMPR